MDIFTALYNYIDTIFMPFYRLPDTSLYGFILGTSVLAIATVVIGEISISLAFRVNKKKISCDSDEINHFQDLSFKALRAGDKASFKACNGIANEAYGKSFFSQIALSASSLWPVFISLGWMQYRFGDITFEVPYVAFGYTASFIAFYIAARIMLGRIKKILRRSERSLNAQIN